MVTAKKTNVELNSFLLRKLTKVRKAKKSDVHQIYNIASSVGSARKIPEQGFLIDDYSSNPKFYKSKLLNAINSLEHFYVAEYERIYGFMIAYKKDEWLKNNPNWVNDVYWRPDFDRSKLDNFLVIDKTAVQAGLTGQGIGSIIYKQLLENLRLEGTGNIFAETIISPLPNFASLQFRKKQNYDLAGMRYESYNNMLYTDLVYYKEV